MARSISLAAPAKVNWHLHILRKRPDGFHELETLFTRLNLADRITLLDRPSGILIRSSASIPKGPANLAYRAAQLLLDDAKISRGIEIRIQKNIPVEAGLGGGSSDAAAVLTGLNRLWKLGYSKKKLGALGIQIGSDVGFFLSEAPYGLGTGRGEKIRPIFSSRRLWHVLVKPPFGISTREAYGEYARLAALGTRSLTPPRGGVKILLRFLESGQIDSLQDGFFNSLELALDKRVKKIFEIKDRLQKNGAIASLLSGSGSTVFGVFKNHKDAIRAGQVFKKLRGYQVFVTR